MKKVRFDLSKNKTLFYYKNDIISSKKYVKTSFFNDNLCITVLLIISLLIFIMVQR